MTTESTRVLVVEDDAMVRQLLSRHLRRNGYVVTEAGNAEEALSCVPEGGCDLVLTDVHLPGDSGVQLARRLRGLQAEQPIVFLTGDTDENLAREAMEEGASGYLLKPFEFFELDAVMRQALMPVRQAQVVPAGRRGVSATSPTPRDLTVHAEEVRNHQRWRVAVEAPERVVIRTGRSTRRRSTIPFKAVAAVFAMIGLGWIAGTAIDPTVPEPIAPAAMTAAQGTNTVIVPYVIENRTTQVVRGE